MNLEQKVKKTRIVRRLPSSEVLAEVEQGRKFIIVENDFDAIPEGYALVDMKYKGDSLKTLVPQSTLFYMANPGDGNIDQALEEVADFYGDVEDIEDEMIINGQTSVQDVNWATTSREAYRLYLINKLIRTKEDGEYPVPEFDGEALNQLDLDDAYVEQRSKLIAALALGKSEDELKKYGIEQVLMHYSKKTGITEEVEKRKIDNAEFRKITEFRDYWRPQRHTKTMRCLADSHYDLLPEYQNNPEWDYDLRTMTKTKRKDILHFEAKIKGVEQEIENYRTQKHGATGRHDLPLLRQYINLAYIIPENKKAQLDIQPPHKNDTQQD